MYRDLSIKWWEDWSMIRKMNELKVFVIMTHLGLCIALLFVLLKSVDIVMSEVEDFHCS